MTIKTTHDLTPTNVTHLEKYREFAEEIRQIVNSVHELDECKSWINDKCAYHIAHIDALLGDK